MAAKLRVLFVANPAAGLARGRDAGGLACRAAEREGASCELARTSAPGDARRLAERAGAEGWSMVVAVGGDGTAHEAANGLAGSATALGVAPAGTMNLLARVLGIPLDVEGAARWLVTFARRSPMMPGDCGGRLFLLMAGIGFDAWVLRELLSRARGKIGFRDYVGGAIRGAATFPFRDVRFDLDGREALGHSAIVGRAPLYGGFLRPTPGASLARPELETCVLSGGAARLLSSIPAMWSGSHAGRPGVRIERGTRVGAVCDDGPVPVQLDGESAGELPADFSISDRKLWLAA